MDSQFVICIWIDQELEVIMPVLRACLDQTPYPVMLIGNFDATSLLQQERISILKQNKALGRGKALERACRAAFERGFTHLITIESQGQYFVSEISHLSFESKEFPASLIIGSRKALLESKPDFLTRYQPIGFVPDPDCRVRIYPLSSVIEMKFFFSSYAFESEAIVRLFARGISVRSIEISNTFLSPEPVHKRFSKWREKYQAGFLRTVLIVIALLREKTDPLKSSLSLALGVFIGTLPIFGLHTVIVAGLAFLFPLSFVYLWLGTHVSLPPFVPILLFLSHYLGNKILQNGTVTVGHVTQSLLLGSLVLAFILSLAAFVIHYLIRVWINKKKDPQEGLYKNVQ